MPIGFSLTFKLLLIAFGAVSVGLWLGETAGWVAACAGLALLHVLHVYQLARLQRWLQSPKADELPDPWGMWGAVFAGVYRALRMESRKRDEVSRDLELFTQAAQALPDGIAMLDSGDQLLWCNDTAAQHLEIGRAHV